MEYEKLKLEIFLNSLLDCIGGTGAIHDLTCGTGPNASSCPTTGLNTVPLGTCSSQGSLASGECNSGSTAFSCVETGSGIIARACRTGNDGG